VKMAFPRFYDLVSAQQWLASRALETVSFVDRITGRRRGTLGVVNGSVEHLSPQSRYGGGYGVVASVLGAHAVSLAAGYTLSEGGCCRLWDVSAGVHLDAGGYEWARLGATVYLPSTAGLAPGDVIYSAEPVYHDWEPLNAFLTAAGSGFDMLAELRNRTAKTLIGGWRWRNGVIVPEGAINFAAVSTTPHGVIASVDSATQVTLSAGHNLTSGLVRLLDVSAGAELGDVQCTVLGNVVTLASTAGLEAGDTLHRVGVSELSIGGSTRACRLAVGSRMRFAGGCDWIGEIYHRHAGAPRNAFVRLYISAYTALSSEGRGVVVGWIQPGTTKRCLGGFSRHADTTIRAVTIADATTSFAAAAVTGAQVEARLCPFRTPAPGVGEVSTGAGSYHSTSPSVAQWNYIDYPSGVLGSVALDGAVASRLSAT
jgi:hypothetical protein